MSRSGLRRFGVVPATSVRLPTIDRDGVQICPEDGKPVATTKGSQQIDHPNVAEEGLTDLDELITHGWRCASHPRPVVMPVRYGGPHDVSAHTLRHSVAWRIRWTVVGRLYCVRDRLRHASILTKEREYDHFQTV